MIIYNASKFIFYLCYVQHLSNSANALCFKILCIQFVVRGEILNRRHFDKHTFSSAIDRNADYHVAFWFHAFILDESNLASLFETLTFFVKSEMS